MAKQRTAADWKREVERLRPYEEAVLAVTFIPVELLTVRGDLEHAASARLWRGEEAAASGKAGSKPPAGDPRYRALLDRSDRDLRKYAEKLMTDFEEVMGVSTKRSGYGPGVRR